MDSLVCVALSVVNTALDDPSDGVTKTDLMSREELQQAAWKTLVEAHLATNTSHTVVRVVEQLLGRLSNYSLGVIGEKREAEYAGIIHEMASVPSFGLSALHDELIYGDETRVVWMFIFRYIAQTDPFTVKFPSARAAMMHCYREAYKYCIESKDSWIVARTVDMWMYFVSPYIGKCE